MLTAINQWCFAEGTSLEDIFSICQRAGYDAVELNMNPSGGVGITIDSTPAEVKEVVKLANNYNLKLTTLSSNQTGFKLGAPDAETRKLGRQVLEKQIELANAMEIDSILAMPGRVNEEMSYDDVYRFSQEELAKVLPKAEEAGVCIALENIWNKFLLSPVEFKRYLEELNSPAVGCYFDVGNILLYGYPEQWIRILGNRISRVHVKDFKSNVGNITGFSHLLSGSVNWPEVLKALKEIGYDNTLTAEIPKYEFAPLQAIFDTARHIEVIKGGEPR